MTRCYEYYCLSDPCKDMSRTSKWEVGTYMNFMRAKGVKFDKTADDKTFFLEMAQKYGTEKIAISLVRKSEPISKWDDKETKRQWLSERDLTEDDIQKKVGFHWRSLSKTDLQRAISPRKESVTKYQSPMTPDERIEETVCLDDKTTIICPNCGEEIEL